jgi:tetratricopeptide (TPR) repeat protein
VRIRRHPSFRELSRLADGTVEPPRSETLRAHLGRCAGCRDKLIYMRELGRTAREISHPSPPAGALSQILQRRAAGERVILPVRARFAAPRRRAAIGLAAGITGTLLASALLLLPADEASAGASDLTFDPPAPQPGAEIAVRYVPASYLAGERMLYLRGAFRRAAEPAPRGGLPGGLRLELHPEVDGSYTGMLEMPKDAVYGYFAVENEDASEVDSNFGRSWDLMAHENGVPTFDALKQRLAVWKNQLQRGRQTAALMEQHYPGSIESALRAFQYQSAYAGTGESRFLAEHKARLRALSDSVEDRWREIPDDELASLWVYSSELGDAEREEVWGRRLRTSASDHQIATQLRVSEELRTADRDELFAIYERAWLSAGVSNAKQSIEYLAGAAFYAAMEAGDPLLAERWGRRYVRLRTDMRPPVAESIARFPELRELAKASLRTGLETLSEPSDARRSLTETRPEARARDRQLSSEMLGALGRVLSRDGKYEAAIDTLERAVELGWNSEAIRSLARTYEASGQLPEALALYFLVIADENEPERRAALADSTRRRLGSSITDIEWEEALRRAEAQVDRRRVLDAGPPVTAAGDPHIQERDGTRVPLSSLILDQVSIVVIWAGSPPSDITLESPRLDRLRANGVRLFTIAQNHPSAELDHILATDFDGLDVYYDVDWEVARSLKVHGVPYHYVVDRNGRFFYTADLGQAMRLAESLEKTAEATA